MTDKEYLIESIHGFDYERYKLPEPEKMLEAKQSLQEFLKRCNKILEKAEFELPLLQGLPQHYLIKLHRAKVCLDNNEYDRACGYLEELIFFEANAEGKIRPCILYNIVKEMEK